MTIRDGGPAGRRPRTSGEIAGGRGAAGRRGTAGRRAAAALLVTGALSGSAASLEAQDPVDRELRSRVELLRETGRLHAAGEPVRHPAAVAEVYEAAGFRPLWVEASLPGLRRAIRSLHEDGLWPRGYPLDLPRPSGSDPGEVLGPEDRAEVDLLRTDALLRASRDLRFGRAAPEGPHLAGSASVETVTGLPVERFLELTRPGALPEGLDPFRPRHLAYRLLKRSLAELRRVEAAGGWEAVPPGPVLRQGDVDARVRILRLRLGGTRVDSTFDAALEAAVRGFQHRHGLNEDGVVGPATLSELNVPVKRRIDQVRVNLERGRWVLHDLPDTALVVNVAGARVYLMHGMVARFEARAIVGAQATRTPVFAATLQSVVLNPTWTVPPGIVGEVLARVQASPEYLARQGMEVLDRAGRPVDPSTIDFHRWTGRTFPYVFRQRPGPINPLGRIKFVFPNRWSVYVHDTPQRELFDREVRTFSHGCIRVREPVVLAEALLEGSDWDRARLEDAMDGGGTVAIDVPRPIPVIVQYWTASADLHGELHFYRDVYDRDPALLGRLDRW